MSKLPKVTFGIIVLNGEPFTRYCLRSLYPFAHEIIVVEGASKFAKDFATPDGHSTDGTLDTLYSFKAKEDPENKVKIVTREGFWSEKDEQSRAYAKLATGDYLWQVDVDEFYRPQDIQLIFRMLTDDPSITGASFKQIAFWGGFDYITDGWYFRRDAGIPYRLFKWGDGYEYVTHRPPTVHDAQGRNLLHLNWINGYQLAKKNIFMYHYSFVFPKQVCSKSAYYDKCEMIGRKKNSNWVKNNYLELNYPYRMHNVYEYPSWIKRFEGEHPPAIQQLMQDIQKSTIEIELRDNRDVENLLCSHKYRLGIKILSYMISFEPIYEKLQLPKSVKHKINNLF